jgi:3',5'-cyclic AMP phosphodiesterase CpdA
VAHSRTRRYRSGVTAVRVILVSDTHLSPDAPEAEANWDAVLRYVAQTSPDVVIHLGDLSLDGAHDPADLHHGRRQLDRLPVGWHAVPGNHDIGDNPWPGGPADSTVDAARCQRWLDIVGPDHWSLTINGWTLLAINAQLPGSGLEAEARQWSWLEKQLGAARNNQRIALVTHKPVTATDAELASSPVYRFLPQPARDRLAGLLGETPLALVLSGHVHQYRRLRLDDTDHLWVPTTWAVLPDQAQPVLGAKRCGIVSLDLASDTAPEPVLVEPDGIAQLTITIDIPNRYQR